MKFNSARIWGGKKSVPSLKTLVKKIFTEKLDNDFPKINLIFLGRVLPSLVVNINAIKKEFEKV
jgi:hypothetical protein